MTGSDCVHAVGQHELQLLHCIRQKAMLAMANPFIYLTTPTYHQQAPREYAHTNTQTHNKHTEAVGGRVISRHQKCICLLKILSICQRLSVEWNLWAHQPIWPPRRSQFAGSFPAFYAIACVRLPIHMASIYGARNNPSQTHTHTHNALYVARVVRPNTY